MSFGVVDMTNKLTSPDLWPKVSAKLKLWSANQALFKYGQQDSIAWIAERIRENGVIVADEVGLGKTRIALLVMLAVLESGGDVLAVVPPGLLFQWNQESKDLIASIERDMPGSIQNWSPVIVRGYWDLFTVIPKNGNYPLANRAERRWVLLSQTFDFYVVRKNAQSWRLELPALVLASRAINAKLSGNDRWIQYHKKRGYDFSSVADQEVFEQKRAAEYLSKLKFSEEMEEILKDDSLRPNLTGEDHAREETVEFFQAGRPGRQLLMSFVGVLLGSVELLVIDEAHKSKDEDDDTPRTRVGRILEEILQTTVDCRRVSLTATPIELNPEQWISLLQRTGIREGHPKWSELISTIQSFSQSLRLAQSRPSHSSALDEVIKASKQFETQLRPFVTRRQRLHQAEMKSLMPEEISGSHPHRNLQPCPIKIDSLDADWRKMVLAIEGQGLASKGLTEMSHAQKQADIRYSSGLTVAFADHEVEGKVLTPQEKRVRAWAKLQSQLSRKISVETGDWLWAHPRILHAADRIEQAGNLTGPYPSEKILVFGRFTDAMKALRDTLTARHVLRILDEGAIAMMPSHINFAFLEATFKERSSKTKFLKSLAGTEISGEKLESLFLEARARYNKASEVLQSRISHDRTTWLAEQVGSATFSLPENLEILREMVNTVRREVFDSFLLDGRDPTLCSQEEIDHLASAIWREHFMAVAHGDDERADESEAKETLTKKKISSGLIRKFVDHFAAEKNERRSEFCRMLDGGVSQVARRSVQASFNRRNSGPYVLVAQSLVGREGLNLHKSCKKVFLFHPEWNPGVMEQQIGRVDRIESLWEEVARAWKTSGGPVSEFPKIDIDLLVFEGTYDEYQGSILRERRASMNAQLFGALLDEKALNEIPEGYAEKLVAAAPSFAPPRVRDK